MPPVMSVVHVIEGNTLVATLVRAWRMNPKLRYSLTCTVIGTTVTSSVFCLNQPDGLYKKTMTPYNVIWLGKYTNAQ
jgi:hypothetical protein